VAGRFYAMDRDRRWERTHAAWEAIVHARGRRAATPLAAVREAYDRGESDEFIEPTVIHPDGAIGTGDAVLHMNFRADRARQLTRALALDDFDAFERGDRPRRLSLATLTEYERNLPVAVAFRPLEIDSLAAYLGRLGKRQLHLAETEKYAHVTYFFNGGVEEPVPGEERVLVPSVRHVATYDLAPEMSAMPITDTLLAAFAGGGFDFAIVNYANPDMVGHTGVWDASVRAAEVIDGCLGRIADAVRAAGGVLLVTGDHGNIEEMRDAEGRPQTAHTTNPVPFLLVADAWRGASLRDGKLADVAPTICEIMGLDPLPSMTGRSLLA
jgi:2,3-bisphosphoglycerate-independent phosphoglycerate mutase